MKTASKIISIIIISILILTIPGCKGQKTDFQLSTASGQAPLTVTFTNLTTGDADEYLWDFGDGTTLTQHSLEEPVTHEYTVAGEHTVTLTAIKNGEASPGTAKNISVFPGAVAAAAISPGQVTLDIGQQQEFTARVTDAYDNQVEGAELTWTAAANLGIISGNTLTAGTSAGTFERGITVTASLDGNSVQGTAPVTVKPGALATLEFPPVEVAAGKTIQPEIMAKDEHGNITKDVKVNFSLLDEDAGTLTEDGHLTANYKAREYPEAITAKVTHNTTTLEATAPIVIVPAEMTQIGIAPEKITLGREMTQQFVAAGADAYGNLISGIDFEWSVSNGGGTIDGDGIFTAGTKAGEYKKTVTVTAKASTETFTKEADVTVQADRIYFSSDRSHSPSAAEDELIDGADIWVMDAEGNVGDALTHSEGVESSMSWSPDGRRTVCDEFDSNGALFIIQEDGSWGYGLLQNSQSVLYCDPAWSPDGSRIVYARVELDVEALTEALTRTPASKLNIYDFMKYDLYVMDIDGGNITRLTDTENIQEMAPSWSPDGTRIVYDRTTNASHGDIYVMNADGTSNTQLTSGSHNDTRPSFSPDGSKILFMSNKDSDYDIYIMNADGTGMQQLTMNNTLGKGNYLYYVQDTEPVWSPDGSRIAFSSNRDEPESSEIYIMEIESREVTRLTNHEAVDEMRSWAPPQKGIKVSEGSIIFSSDISIEEKSTTEITAEARQATVRIVTELSSGSGFIIREDGLILTNNHVISDAEDVTVYLDDGTEYTAKVKGRDLVHDLAVLSINANNLPVLEFANIGAISNGDRVLALGYPLRATDATVTSGIVSSIVFDSGRNINWIQTDAAVNPGNSGGPMLTADGKVAGIITLKYVGFGIEGVAYAVSANTIQIYLERLIDGETIYTE